MPLSFTTTLSASASVVEVAEVLPSTMLSSVAVEVTPSKILSSAPVEVIAVLPKVPPFSEIDADTSVSPCKVPNSVADDESLKSAVVVIILSVTE